MYSLPFISHHLFVEAVASEARPHARPARHDWPPLERTVPAAAIPVELIADRNPLPAGATYLRRTSVAQAQI
jgi:hypothetical protein